MLSLLVKLTLVISTSVATDVHLYVFSSNGCPPCQAMKPGVDQLMREGFPVTSVNVREQPQLARRFDISRTPTTVMVVDGQMVGRHSGPIAYAGLRNWFKSVGFEAPSTRDDASIASPSHPTSDPLPTAQATQEPLSKISDSGRNTEPPPQPTEQWTPHQRAYQATVRLRIDDGQGTSVGTGTVIHTHGQESLVLTCGHIFREAGKRGTIHADFGFAVRQPRTVPGQLIYYDAGPRDIALVTIKTPYPIVPVSVAPRGFNVATGDEVFSVGCNRGADPTIRKSVVKQSNRYDGALKYDTVGRPVDGRSGGGLFSAGGQLIGVCNAAAVEVDEGIYTALENVYWQFDQVRLSHLFDRPNRDTAGTALASDNVAPAALASATERTPVDYSVNVPTTAVALPRSSQELILIMRSPTNPEDSETVFIRDPSPELMRAIQVDWERSQSRAASGEDPPAVKMPNIPVARRETWGSDSVRAQSPR